MASRVEATVELLMPSVHKPLDTWFQNRSKTWYILFHSVRKLCDILVYREHIPWNILPLKVLLAPETALKNIRM